LSIKIENVTAGLNSGLLKVLHKLALSSEGSALFIANYILSMKTEINLSDNYRRENIKLLCNFSKYHNDKPFRAITRDNILAFLDSFRRPEASDPLHRWIGTYNLFRTCLLRFFKWLYYPDIEPSKRPKPEIIQNIPQLKRKEKSVYKPTDLWTAEDDLLFLRYCPSRRMKCFHTMAYDTGCRPHELLKLKIKDVVFKNAGNRQYAEVLVNGKTGSRHIPLIDSLPYVKDYLVNEHPMPGNPNIVLMSGIGKKVGKAIGIIYLHGIYSRYKKEFFPKLLEDASIPMEEKEKIRELLRKPWNPYVRRHSALTQKSKILKEATLRQFAGWTTNSNMPQIYTHYYGNEASESLLEAYGIVTKDQQLSNVLRPKQCPNCNEPNKPDSKFCGKCKMIMTFEGYQEALEEQKKKEDRLTAIEEQMRALVTALANTKEQNRVDEVSKMLFQAGIVRTDH
jgi:integrase